MKHMMEDHDGKGGMKPMSGHDAEKMCDKMANDDMATEEHAGMKMNVQRRKGNSDSHERM